MRLVVSVRKRAFERLVGALESTTDGMIHPAPTGMSHRVPDVVTTSEVCDHGGGLLVILHQQAGDLLRRGRRRGPGTLRLLPLGASVASPCRRVARAARRAQLRRVELSAG